MRRLLAETRLDASRFVLPLFVQDGLADPASIEALPGHRRWAPEQAATPAKEAAAAGIPAVLIFGIPDRKDAAASRAYAADGPAQRAVAAIKESAPDLAVFADTCLCSFTDTGHCGVLRDGEVDNDASVELIARAAAAQAAAGADVVAPSDM
ncbi:MAG TPA: porphobilinogen synthase, partial [Actinomycetota bacterium]|nr:porphobilinogen synthase [Actinomycetota bacterium]